MPLCQLKMGAQVPTPTAHPQQGPPEALSGATSKPQDTFPQQATVMLTHVHSYELHCFDRNQLLWVPADRKEQEGAANYTFFGALSPYQYRTNFAWNNLNLIKY